MARLLDLLQASYDVTPVEIRSPEETPFQRKLNYYCKVPLLLLDDLGVEKMTEWRLEKLDTIVNYRYENKLPLVVSTNLPFSQMSRRIADRLLDKRIGKFVVLSGPSYRTDDENY
ncbi:MAG: ATP-binding protein [Chloroflexota bacterium]